jgi:hypothetical protein
MSETLTQTLARAPITATGLAAGDALPLLDVSATGLSKDAAVVLAELVKALFAYNASTNASGNTTITPGVVNLLHREVTTVSGSGGETRVFVLATSNTPRAGNTIRHRVHMPATADITLEWRNATAGGTLITSLITDGSGDDALLDFYYDGSAWQLDAVIYPANA